ncbi:MAG: amidase family protein [Oscillospiraceae bacterium]|nr:amidase family protein [Oscillospiraceae bacterium]
MKLIKDFAHRGNGSVLLEDNIMLAGVPAHAGSEILKGFTSPITATVATRLQAAGFAIAGTVATDELGIPSFFDNPAPPDSVTAVASGEVEFALANDIFGRVRAAAALAGVCYIRPTYGTVSRFGLIPTATSMDAIGVVCRDPARGYELLEAIAGWDEKDGAMYQPPEFEGEFDETPPSHEDKARVATLVHAPVDLEGAVKIDLPYAELYGEVLYILAAAEFSNNVNRYDGIAFGHRAADFRGLDELYTNTRAAFGIDVKLAAIMGAGLLSSENYATLYEQAMKLRRLICDSVTFDGYDAIALPCPDSLTYENLGMFALPALTGLPCRTLGGVQYVTKGKL